MPDLVFPDVTQEEYDTAGSKFITFPAGATPGAVQYRDVEVSDVDWDTPGQSIKIVATVIEEGPDLSKQDKLSFGVVKTATGKSGIWKGKLAHIAITGKEMAFVDTDKGPRPKIDPTELVGKKAIAEYTLQLGHKGGDPEGEEVLYPKLTNFLSAGKKPAVAGLV